MLSRTASNLFWLSRYFERAESTVRLLNACFQPGMPFEGDINQLYALPLHIESAYKDFKAQHEDLLTSLSINTVSEFLIRGNTNASVRYCLEMARENARSERSRLSTELWEAINQTWLEFDNMQYKSLGVFKEWLQQRSFMIQGIIEITLPDNLNYHFLRLGTFLERSDQTLRVLEAQTKLQDIGNYSDYYHWNMLLKAVSSFEAYQETFVEVPSQQRVFKFLLFNRHIPRSVRYCAEKTHRLLEEIGGEKRRGALRASSQMLNKLRYDTAESIISITPKKYIEELQGEVIILARAIQEGYFVTI